MEFRPREYQKLIIDFVQNNERCAVWASMGLGKTASVLTALRDDDFPALVLAQVRVARTTWPQEVEEWDHLSGLRVSVVTGTSKAKIAALNKQADIYSTNYETISLLAKELGHRWPFRTIIADESTRLKSFRLRGGSKRAALLARCARESTRFIELSGTPAPNGLIDLWGQVWFIDDEKVLGKSFTAYTNRWFRPERVGADPHAIKHVPLPHADREIRESIKHLCIAIDAKDWFDVKDPIISNIRVDLPSKARAVYESMSSEMYARLPDSDEEIEAVSAASKTIKCLQLANGALYRDGGGYEEVHKAKIEALDSIVTEAAGEPLLVAYHFKSDLQRLLKAFPQSVELDKKPETIRRWNNGDIPILLAHPASAGHGLNLQHGGNRIAFFGHWWNLEEREQIIERIGPVRQMQSGYDRPVFIYNIIARDTVDEAVLLRLRTKCTIQQALLDAMK